MLSCYILANTIWVAIAADIPATVNVDSIVSIRAMYGYEDSYTIIYSGYRNVEQVPLAYPAFMIEFNDCLKQAENKQ